MRFYWLLSIGWTFGMIGAAATHAAEPPFVIENTTIFDSVTRKMTGGQTLVVEGSRITAVRPAGGDEKYPEGARLIDGRGKFVIPGLIDVHVHLVHRIDYAHVTGDEILPLFLAAGVTSVRSTGDEIIAQTVVAHFAESNPMTCPRMFLASGLIDGNPPIHKDVGIPITDPAKVPELVADLVILDADPTIDIRHTRRIHTVIHHGLVCDREAALRAVPKR